MNFTVHESSFLHVHSIQAASLDKMDMAYIFYLKNIPFRFRLTYNKEVEEGWKHLYGWNVDEYCEGFEECKKTTP
jgi:hypothetical protein